MVIHPSGHRPFSHGHDYAFGIVPPGEMECAANAQPHENLVAAGLEVASPCRIAVVAHHVERLFEAITLVPFLVELEPQMLVLKPKQIVGNRIAAHGPISRQAHHYWCVAEGVSVQEI